MGKLRKYVGISLLFVYAFFFASTNFFYHSHQLPDGTIVHSHPFSDKNHNHTVNQILLLEAISAETIDPSSQSTLPTFTEGEGITICTAFVSEARVPQHKSVNLLRAPPCL